MDDPKEPDFDYFWQGNRVMVRCLCGKEFKESLNLLHQKCPACNRERHYELKHE